MHFVFLWIKLPIKSEHHRSLKDRVHLQRKMIKMKTQEIKPSQEAIMQIGSGFWASKILLTAVDFELFTHLAKNKRMTAREIKSLLKLNCTNRHLYDFLDALFVFGFLERKGLLELAVYTNSLDTDTFLDKAKAS